MLKQRDLVNVDIIWDLGIIKISHFKMYFFSGYGQKLDIVETIQCLYITRIYVTAN